MSLSRSESESESESVTIICVYYILRIFPIRKKSQN